MKKKSAKKKAPVKTAITKLARVMFEKQIKLEDLKAKSGVSHDVISKIKNGTRKDPQTSTMQKIAKALTELSGDEIKIDDII